MSSVRSSSLGGGSSAHRPYGGSSGNYPATTANQRELRTLDLRLRTGPKKSVSPTGVPPPITRPQYVRQESNDSSHGNSPVLKSNGSFSSGSPTWSRRNSLKAAGTPPMGPATSPTKKSFHLPPQGSASTTPQQSQHLHGNNSTSSSLSPGGGLSSLLTQAGSAGSMLPPPLNSSPNPTGGSKQRSNSLGPPPPSVSPLPRAGSSPGNSNLLGNNSFGSYGNRSSSVSSTTTNSVCPNADVDQSNNVAGFQPPKNLSAITKAKLRKVRSQGLNLSPCRGLAESMLPPATFELSKKNLLVLDIDETLVHASFTPETKHDVKITITVGNETGHIYVAFRPHMMTFLKAVAPLFEIAIFTASQSCYAQQLMDYIDPGQKLLGPQRLFREHCTEVNGARVKDLSLLGRRMEKLTIIDNSPVAYLFQPRNAIPILSWFDDPTDTELLRLIPFLKQLSQESSVYDMLDYYNAGALTV